MKNKEKCFVSGPLALILRVSRYFGSAPLQFQKQGNGWMVSFSLSSSFYGYFLMTLAILANAWCIFKKLQDQIKINFAWTVDSIVLTIAIAIMVYDAPRRMRWLIVSLNHFHEIHSDLNICHNQMWTKNLIALFIVWGTIVAATVVGTIAALYNRFALTYDVWINAWFTVYHSVVVQTTLMQFFLVVQKIQFCFRGVNDCLENLLQHKATKLYSRLKYIKVLSSAYSSACEMVYEVNNSLGLMLFSLICSICFQFIITFYYFIVNFCQEGFFVAKNLVLLFWCTYHMFSMLIVIEPCHMASMEKEKTRELVSRVMLSTQSAYDALYFQVDQFCKQIILHDYFTSFTPMSIIIIERNLVLQIASNVTTYLVVLVDIK